MTSRTPIRLLRAALLAGPLAASSLGFTASAHADGPHHWCPGQRHDPPTGPGDVVWDWNVCHTFYFTNYRMGNVVLSYDGNLSDVWDGDDPPLEAITPRQCPPIAFMCP